MNKILAYMPLIIFLTLWLGVAYYYSRKIEKHKNSIQVDDSRPENCITLIRGIDQTNYIRLYKVIIDGKVVDSIASGETKHFSLPPGEYTIQVKIDWCKSKSWPVILNLGQNVELRCGANYNDWRCLFMSLIKPSSYVYVESA